MSPARRHRVDVSPLPPWLDARRLLDDGDWQSDGSLWHGERSAPEAADLAARLRGLVLDGEEVACRVYPKLARPLVRAARTEDARRRRDTTPGFLQPGARASGEGRFSLSPEPLARALGRRAAGLRVLDAGCGAGGNTLGFAAAGCEVLAVDHDAGRLADARHNAATYGLTPHIDFHLGDAIDAARTAAVDLIFVDPPWSDAPKAANAQDLPPLPELLAIAQRRQLTLWAKLPPGFRTASAPKATYRAAFGAASGDRRRIKWVLGQWPAELSGGGDAPAP